MTKDEFEAAYAQRSNVTVEALHEMGRYGTPCDCGEEICEGWQMARIEDQAGSGPVVTPRGYLVLMDGDLDYFTESEHMARAHELSIHSALGAGVKTEILACYAKEQPR